MQQLPYNSSILSTIENRDNRYSNVYINRPDTFEYLLVVNTDQQISKQVLAEKKAFNDRYHTGLENGDQFSISVMKFTATEAMEETIAKWMQRICCLQESFIVTLNNYSGFPTGNIHLRVQYNQPFQKLANELKVIDNYIKSYGFPAARIRNHPHLTLAGHLPEAVYSKAIFDYAKHDFHGSFVVNELILMKRKHQFDAAKKINIFRLLPTIASTADC